jgi:histone H3/H4
MASDMMVVASKVKAHIKEKGCMTSGDAVEALNCAVACMLDKAVERTKANKRSTVKPQDL